MQRELLCSEKLLCSDSCYTVRTVSGAKKQGGTADFFVPQTREAADFLCTGVRNVYCCFAARTPRGE